MLEYKLISKNSKKEHIININGVEIGKKPIIIAGPCAVESEKQTLTIAKEVKKLNVDMLRGGAFKPRTFPYSFQGLGEKGLKILKKAKELTNLPIVTEVIDPRQVSLVAKYADVLQIGARNMQNYPLLIEAGKTKKPILLKRGMWATLSEFLGAAEYIALQDNLNIILCERGIRTFMSNHTYRDTPDFNIVRAVKRETFLPIIFDPCHSTGNSKDVEAASKAAISYGFDGLLVEVMEENKNPSKVKCDGSQSIYPSQLKNIIKFINKQ